eukprot:TRINITY_DN31078_c0_g1_i1.p1 TRINITY_DN31078_c0_g1~~TRINITY_DN31078_c0_g1_i1.p1  ORF type:complete len:298 (+),score=43.62 TRINITY_DN31078_c0_g1_i1:27-920(+)
MEDAILTKWSSMSKDDSLFKSPFAAWEQKEITGSLNLIVRYSDPHWGAKRGGRHNPERVNLVKEFDASKFNFTKVGDNEIITTFGDGGQHAVIFNVSPMLLCHSLIVPFLAECHPQVMFKKALQTGINFISDCKQYPESCLLFNSLGAFASVNHFHFHYVRQHLPALVCPRRKTNVDGFSVVDFPTQVLVLSTLVLGLDAVFEAIDFLTTNNIAYNIVITQIGEVILTPRKNQDCNTGEHRIAVIEILGCATAGSRQEFDDITEDSFVATLEKEIRLPDDQCQFIISTLENIFQRHR